MILGHVFAHPLPEAFDRIKVRAVTGKGLEDETELSGFRLNNLGPMTRSAIPNNHDRTGKIAQPVSQVMQKLDGVFAVAIAFIPDEALSLREIIGPIPVDTVAQRWTITVSPGSFTDG